MSLRLAFALMSRIVAFASLSSLARVAVRPCRAEITVATDFEGGSAKVLALDQATKTVRICPAGDPARGWPCWWYLRVDGLAKGDKLTLEVVAYRRAARRSGQEPRQAAGGRLVASRSGPAFRTDGKQWRHSEPGRLATAR